MVAKDGNCAPNRKARAKLTPPAVNPFIEAIQVASAKDTLRVRLLSIPHARQAPKTARAGKAVENWASPGQLITIAPITMVIMPSATRGSKFSRNANHAKSAVNTPSAFSSKDAPDAGILVNPNIKRTGPTTPPANIAPRNQSHSLGFSFTIDELVTKRLKESPTPEPR